MSPASLDGVDVKITRAKRHLADLQGELERVLQPDRQRFVLEHDDETGKHVLKVDGVPAIDPMWSAIVGDCLFDLRSALDHLAWQLVILDGKQPSQNTQFPARESALNKAGTRIGAQLVPRVARRDILDALESVQPYSGVGGVTDSKQNPLWMLSKLNNIDKHRLLLVIVCVPDPGHMWWGLDEGDPSPTVEINWAALTDGSPVAWFDFHGAEPPADFDPHPALQIVLNEGDTPRLTGIHLPEALNMLRGWVEDTIVNYTFRKFF